MTNVVSIEAVRLKSQLAEITADIDRLAHALTPTASDGEVVRVPRSVLALLCQHLSRLCAHLEGLVGGKPPE